MAIAYPVTVSTTNQVARPAKSRTFLGVYNQSAGTIYIALDTPAVNAATAGQFTIAAGASITWGPGDPQAVPSGAINMIGAAGPATIVE